MRATPLTALVIVEPAARAGYSLSIPICPHCGERHEHFVPGRPLDCLGKLEYPDCSPQFRRYFEVQPYRLQLANSKQEMALSWSSYFPWPWRVYQGDEMISQHTTIENGLMALWRAQRKNPFAHLVNERLQRLVWLLGEEGRRICWTGPMWTVPDDLKSVLG